MSKRSGALVLAIGLAIALISVGCRKAQQVEETPEVPADARVETPAAPEKEPTKEVTEPFGRQPIEAPEQVPPPSIEELNRSGVLRTVLFAYDSAELDPEARSVLQANADWLAENPDHTVRIEGHCDERGTIEYNIALGDRRAKSVRDYLVGLGIDASRLRVVSYGEEKPVDPGHDESAWSRNRRAEFVIVS